MTSPLRFSLISLVLVLALVAAACGSDDPAASSLPGDATGEPAALPPNTNPAAPPLVSSACAEDEPDCDDTVSIDDTPVDLPSDGGDVAGPSGALVDGGLTIADALASNASGLIAVRGFLVADETGARLCEALAESYPPQCGGADMPVTGWEEALTVPTQSAQGVTWTDDVVSLLGEFVDGTFVVDPTAAQ
jgi:hypothetical protein